MKRRNAQEEEKEDAAGCSDIQNFGQELSGSLIALETCTRGLLRVDEKMDLEVNYSVRIEVDLKQIKDNHAYVGGGSVKMTLLTLTCSMATCRSDEGRTIPAF